MNKFTSKSLLFAVATFLLGVFVFRNVASRVVPCGSVPIKGQCVYHPNENCQDPPKPVVIASQIKITVPCITTTDTSCVTVKINKTCSMCVLETGCVQKTETSYCTHTCTSFPTRTVTTGNTCYQQCQSVVYKTVKSECVMTLTTTKSVDRKCKPALTTITISTKTVNGC